MEDLKHHQHNRMTNLCDVPMGIQTLKRVPSAGHGRTVNKHSSQIPKGSGENEMLNFRSHQRGEHIQALLKVLQSTTPHCESSQNPASHMHTSHPKPEPRQKVVLRNHKPVPLPRKSKGITPHKSARFRASGKRTVSSDVDKQNLGTTDYITFKVSKQYGHMRRKPPIRPRTHPPSRPRVISISTQTTDIASQLTGDKVIETFNSKGIISEDSFTELECVNAVSDSARTRLSRSESIDVANETDGRGLSSPPATTASACDARHRQMEIPVPKPRRTFDLSQSYVSYNPDIPSPPRTGSSLVDEDWIDEPIFEVQEPAKPASLLQRTHSRLHRLSNVVGLSYHQRAGSYVRRSRVGRRSRTEVIEETDQPSDADSDDGQWETDTSSDDDAVDYDLAESAPELAGQRSPMARHPQTGAEKKDTKQMTTKDDNDEDYVLGSPSDSLASSPRVPPSGRNLDKHVTCQHLGSRLQSSDSIDVKVPLAKRNTHQTLCSTDSNYSVSSWDSSLDVTPSPPLPKREPKNVLKNKLVSKKQVVLSQLVSIPSEKRRPSDCLPRPPPPPPHRDRQKGAAGKKRSETDSEYDDWKSCDSSHNSVRSLDTVLKGHGPPPLPPRSTWSVTGVEKGEKAASDTDTKPLFDKRALEATLSLEIPYQSDWCTDNKSSSRSRGVCADNASTTSDGLSDFDQDTDLRSSLSDHSSHTPYYLELIADDDQSGVPKKSCFDDEPLYQIYHKSIIARNLRWQNESDTDSSSAPPSRTSSLLNPGGNSPIITGSKKSMIQALLIGTDANASRLWCDMPEVVRSGVLDTMNTAEKKLQETLFEIIMSEASYLKSLHLVIKHFAQSVEFDALHSPAAILTKRDYKILFSNIESVWTVSARFLGLLERVWNHNPILSPGQICGLIAEYAARHFDVYINYCTNQMFQNRKLGELKKNNDFMEVLTRLENHPQCKGLSMRSFLLLPVQRITRLPLLVDGVCHRMDTASPDYPVAMKCLHVLQKLAKQCNEGAKRMHNLEEMTRINQLLDFRNVRTIALVSESRSLVKQGQLTRILTSSQGILDKWTRRKELLHLFLFNDILLITKKRGERYEVIDSAPRISIHADIIQEDQVTNWLPNGSPRHCKNLFVMALLEKTTEYIFSADSMSERTRWVEATTPSQQVNEDETIYESWDCPQVQVIERYEPNQPDELQLEESDVVDVFRKMADGWFEGERIRDGERGWFPSSCTVEIVGEHRRAKNMRQRYRLLHSMQAFN